MTIGTLSLHCAVALLAIVLSPVGAFSQTEVVPEGLVADQPESAQTDVKTYGLSGETFVPVNAYDFEGLDSSTTTGWEQTFNRRFRTAGTAGLIAGVNLPNGAQITKIEMSGCDDDASQDLEAFLIECLEPSMGCNVGASVFSTAGQPGCATFTTTLPTPRTVNNTTTTYSLQVNLQTANSTLRFRRVGLYYRLQVSPAPVTATFTDVPVGHPQRRFVEALAAAGITGGCGGSLFCPDAALTRGQMAVFLSAALGLHWPN